MINFIKTFSFFLLGVMVVGVILSLPRKMVVVGSLTVEPELTYVNLTTLKITCFTGYECNTPICNSGKIKPGDVALNPKWGKNRIVIIGDQKYFAKWISDKYTDIDIWFGPSYTDYLRCLDFGVKYLEVELI